MKSALQFLKLTSLFCLSFTFSEKSPVQNELSCCAALADTNSMLLADMSGVSLTLDDIKRKHTGKIIFIEYWAGWCAPCRALMPRSEHIREKVKDLNVAYIYLSFDSDHEQWTKACREERIDKYANNYRILNVRTSEFMKKYNINFIPQAMVLGKSGLVLKTQLYPGAETLIPYLTKLSQIQ